MFVIELKHLIKHLNDNWNPNVVSSSSPNWTSIKQQWKKFGKAVLNCDCLRLKVAVKQSIRNFLQRSFYNPNIEMNCPMILKLSKTQHIIWKCLAKFDDTADPFLVLVLQPCGCGTELEQGTWSGHEWCGLLWWMTWRDRSGWLVGSTSGLLSPKRIVLLWIAFWIVSELSPSFKLLFQVLIYVLHYWRQQFIGEWTRFLHAWITILFWLVARTFSTIQLLLFWAVNFVVSSIYFK